MFEAKSSKKPESRRIDKNILFLVFQQYFHSAQLLFLFLFPTKILATLTIEMASEEKKKQIFEKEKVI